MRDKKDKNAINFSWWDLIKAFYYLLDEKKKPYIFWLAILFLIHFYTIIPPLVIGKIVDFFTNFKTGNSLTPFYIYALFLGSSFSIISFIRLSLKKHLGNLQTDIIYNIRVKGFEKLLNLALIESREETAGEKAQKIQNGTGAFRSLVKKTNNEIFQSLAAVIGIFFVFLFLRLSYVIFLLLYIIGFFAIIKVFYSKIQQLNYEFNKAIEKSSGSYIEGLSNILTIKTLGAKKSFGSHIAQKEDIRKKFEYQIRRYGVGQWIVFQVFNGACIATFLLLVGRDVFSGLVSLGSIVMFYGYLDRLTGSAGQILSIYEQIIGAKTAMARMMPIFWTKVKFQEGQKSFTKSWDKIEIKNASFDYKPDKKSKDNQIGVSNINLSIKKYEKVGIVGKTGSGKSTLAKLFLGLFRFDSGTFQIDRTDFYDIKHEEIIERISLVLQETEMFNLSLKDNITLMRKVEPELFQKAIVISQLEEVIDKLSEGIDTLVGEKGYHLSGGERQRIGIARAICKNSQIIIFDEATSSLDSKTEQLIQNALEAQLDRKTLIFITHRVSTLKDVDRIYVFENGKIVEQGKFKKLLKKPSSKFAQFYRLQMEKKK